MNKGKKVELRESFSIDLASGKVDLEGRVIRDCALMNNTSLNCSYPKGKGRDYTPASQDDVINLCEGITVYTNHLDRKAAKRSRVRPVEEQAGFLKGLYKTPSGVRIKEFHVPEDKFWILQRARDMPHKFGFSFDGNGLSYFDESSKREVVERITEAFSVDLVSQTGSTVNLFESHEPEEEGDEIMDLTKLTLQEFREGRPDLLKTLTAELSEGDETKRTVLELSSKVKDLTETNQKQGKELDDFKAATALEESRKVVDKEVLEAKLPKEMVTKPFMESLYGAEDVLRKSLIKERQDLAKSVTKKKPFSEEADPLKGSSGPSKLTDEALIEAVHSY